MSSGRIKDVEILKFKKIWTAKKFGICFNEEMQANDSWECKLIRKHFKHAMGGSKLELLSKDEYKKLQKSKVDKARSVLITSVMDLHVFC